MLNQVILVGRLTRNPEIVTHKNNIKRTVVDLAVQRSYKNIDGIYETDFVKCILWNGIAEHACTYCKKGDLIGLKGRIQTSNYEDENNKKCYATEIIAEKITFLSSAKNNEQSISVNEEE